MRVRRLDGPPGSPALVLLHGLGATADLNWLSCYERLARRVTVLGVDLRGHGDGPRGRLPFRLEACADDVAALTQVLRIPRLVAAGYSMGGPVAQLLWRRHRRLVDGLVLCATAGRFSGSGARQRALGFGAVAATGLAHLGGGWLVPEGVRRQLVQRLVGDRVGPRATSWASSQLRRHDPAALVQAAAALGAYHAESWLPTVDVPTAVVVTERDRLVSPALQRELAWLVPGATVHPVAADHAAPVTAPDAFAAVLERAVLSVVARNR